MALQIEGLKDLNERLKQKYLEGLWKTFSEQPLKLEPSSSMTPWVWPWEDLSAGLAGAEEFVSLNGAKVSLP
jgi:gentisate 1,2-dioxygenase